MPLQSYFRLNAAEAGQFEHTLIIVEEGADLHFIEGCSAPKYKKNVLHAGAVELIVKKGARMRYSTIENWSRNMYNLNTKKSQSLMKACNGMGIRIIRIKSFNALPYDCPKRRRFKMWITGVTFAAAGQYLDTGCKIVRCRTKYIFNSTF